MEYTLKPHSELEDLAGIVMEELQDELDKDEAWLKLARNLVDDTGTYVISDESQMQMRKSPSPGRQLLHLLSRNLIQVHEFQEMLRKCHLYHILKKINTNVPAKFQSPEEDSQVSISLGECHEMSVEVEGSPYPDLQWYYNDNPLSGQTSHKLVLENFRVKDSGVYTCKIRQSHSGKVTEITSKKYILSVEKTTPIILKDLFDKEVATHNDLILAIEVTGYPEPQSFKWFKNDKFYHETTIPQIKVERVDDLTSGKYHCEVCNGIGSCKTRRANIKVLDPVLAPEKPEIIREPTPYQECYECDLVDLYCEAVCRDQVKFTCFLNNEICGNSKYCRITLSKSGCSYRCNLKYILSEEKSRKPLHFRFEVASPIHRVLSSEAKVKVKKKERSEHLTARNKWALLVGMTDYKHIPLEAPINDIRDMTKKLNDLNFRVMQLFNLERMDFLNAVRLFSTLLQKGDYVVFCFAGHGLHDNGKNYMIPLDACHRSVPKSMNVYHASPENNEYDDISVDECISDIAVTNIFQEAEPALIFSVYDMCRELIPRPSGSYKVKSSQDQYQRALSNSYVIFATSENYRAYEYQWKKSLLMDHLTTLMSQEISVQELGKKLMEWRA